MNTSGIEPCGNKVLVKPDKLEQKTKGGIVIPDDALERHQHAAHYGYVIALGPDCFKHTVTITERLIDGHWKEVERKTVGYTKPWVSVGDRIAFARYTGLLSDGEDGETYRVINDEDITSVVTPKVTQTTIEARKAFASGD